MQIPTKKLNTGFEIPVFGLGTWQMGGRFEYNETNNDEADIQAIKAAIDAGITHIDTAEIYAAGHAETFVGKAIENYDRSKLFLVSKVGKEHLKYDDVVSACKSSLERLGVDYLDLYLIHMPNPSISLQETMKAMDFLKENGLIKNIGVCNFTPERLEEAQMYTKNKIVYNQVHYNLIFREPERKNLLKYCQEHDIFLAAWRPLQKGELIDGTPLVLQEMCEKYKRLLRKLLLIGLFHSRMS